MRGEEVAPGYASLVGFCRETFAFGRAFPRLFSASVSDLVSVDAHMARDPIHVYVVDAIYIVR